MKTVLCILFLAISAQAGVFDTVTYVPRHPKKSGRAIGKAVVTVAKIATYPVRHPKKFWVLVPAHQPMPPPGPWSDGVIARVAGEF